MGNIDISNIEKARVAALRYLNEVSKLVSEADFLYFIIVFSQLLNCTLYKQVGSTCKLTVDILQKRCRDKRIV